MERKINNLGLGICHILKENENGYLIYSETNAEHFIVVSEIINNKFYDNCYFNSLDKALEYFNSMEIEKTNFMRYERYVTLELDLVDIKAYTGDALEYLESTCKENYDVEELKMYLSCIPEIVDEIYDIIIDLIEVKNS